jgi:RNA polymerase sigma-70 factor (ECF subfamily)
MKRELNPRMVERLQSGALVLARPLAGSGPSVATECAITAERLFALVLRQMRVLGGHRDVEELAQIAVEQALRSLPAFGGRSKLSTWTFRICYLTIRKHDRWTRRWLRRFTLTERGELPEVSEPMTGPDEQALLEERIGRVRAALEMLSPKRRAVVVLHDMEGLPVEEIADIVGARAAAVRSRLRDGRKALAERLTKDPYFGADACRRNVER